MTGHSTRTGLYENNKLKDVETIHIEYLDRAYAGVEETADYWIIGGHTYMEGLPNCDVRLLGQKNESTSGQIKQIINGEAYGVSETQTLLAKPLGVNSPNSMPPSERKLRASGQYAFQPDDLTPKQRGDIVADANERQLFVMHAGVSTSVSDDQIVVHVEGADREFQITADTELIANDEDEKERGWFDSIVAWVSDPRATALFADGDDVRIVTELGSDKALSVENGYIEYPIWFVGPAL